jgi:hypothetical protein
MTKRYENPEEEKVRRALDYQENLRLLMSGEEVVKRGGSGIPVRGMSFGINPIEIGLEVTGRHEGFRAYKE